MYTNEQLNQHALRQQTFMLMTGCVPQFNVNSVTIMKKLVLLIDYTATLTITVSFAGYMYVFKQPIYFSTFCRQKTANMSTNEQVYF